MSALTPDRSRSPAKLLRRALEWLASPQAAGMARTEHRLLASSANPDLGSALIHEALLGERLGALGFAVRSEVRARGGRSCDLVAIRDGIRVHLHVKGVRVPVAIGRPLPHPLRALQRIRRRLVVEIEIPPSPTTRVWTSIVTELASFIRRASISDEHVVRDRSGRVRLRCRIRSAHLGRTIVLLRGIEPARERTRQRIIRAMRKAHAQFLSGGENVIVLHGAAHSRLSVDDALLGTSVERWDHLPRRRERIALGRADNGFWSGGAAPESRLVAWIQEDAPDRHHALHARGAPSLDALAICQRLFAARHTVPSSINRS